MRPTRDAYDKLFGTVYLGIVGNLLVAVACSPVLLLLIATPVDRSWPLLALVGPLCGPAFCAAFGMFAHFDSDGPSGLTAAYLRTWRRSLRQSLRVGFAACAGIAVLAVDIDVTGRNHLLAVLIPLFVALCALVVATSLLLLVGAAELPTARLRDLVRTAPYLALRRWHLTAMSLVALWLLATVTLSHPVMGAGVAMTPVLYLAWANARATLQPVLPQATV
jgi:uncharacterized membrane protein YesL